MSKIVWHYGPVLANLGGKGLIAKVLVLKNILDQAVAYLSYIIIFCSLPCVGS